MTTSLAALPLPLEMGGQKRRLQGIPDPWRFGFFFCIEGFLDHPPAASLLAGFAPTDGYGVGFPKHGQAIAARVRSTSACQDRDPRYIG